MIIEWYRAVWSRVDGLNPWANNVMRAEFRWHWTNTSQFTADDYCRTRHCPLYLSCYTENSLLWRHNERDGASNHQCLKCLHNRLFRLRSKKTSKRWPMNSPHKGPVTRKIFSFDDVIMWEPRCQLRRYLWHWMYSLWKPTISPFGIYDDRHFCLWVVNP